MDFLLLYGEETTCCTPLKRCTEPIMPQIGTSVKMLFQEISYRYYLVYSGLSVGPVQRVSRGQKRQSPSGWRPSVGVDARMAVPEG